MSDRQRFRIGSAVHCSDGRCGTLVRLLADPRSENVAHLVVEYGHRHRPTRLVPVDLVLSAEDEIRLRCSRAQFDALESAEEIEVVQSAPMPDLMGVDLAGGSRIDVYMAPPSMKVVHECVPLGEVTIRRGTGVTASDGEIGTAQGLVVRSSDHHVTHVLVECGHLWDRKTVAIPITAVAGLDDVAHVTLTKAQVRELPQLDAGLLS